MSTASTPGTEKTKRTIMAWEELSAGFYYLDIDVEDGFTFPSLPRSEGMWKIEAIAFSSLPMSFALEDIRKEK